MFVNFDFKCDGSAGGRQPHIIVRASATDQNQMLIQVIDNGPGVADQERIFDAFVTAKINGMGIASGRIAFHRRGPRRRGAG